MNLYRYFNVGKGKVVQYSEESTFTPYVNVQKEFSLTSSVSGKAKKKKVGAKFLFFCPELSCTKVFEKECKTKQAEWDEIVKTRADEKDALADTIKMLNSDDALELFKGAIENAK